VKAGGEGLIPLQRGSRRKKLCSSVLYVDGSPGEVLQQVVLPVLILLMGLGFSIAALYVALLPWLDARNGAEGRKGLRSFPLVG
jgi:hypothetical protein